MVKIHYTGSRENAQSFIDLIDEVINKLPEDIQKKIHVSCMIFLIDTGYGYFIGEPQNNIILLNVAQIKKDQLSIKNQEYIIAHEFSHFILNHVEYSTKEENESNELLIHWGFSKDE